MIDQDDPRTLRELAVDFGVSLDWLHEKLLAGVPLEKVLMGLTDSAAERSCAERPDMRAAIEAEVRDHPGLIEILGVRLDLSNPPDAALAAKWLDTQLPPLMHSPGAMGVLS